MEERNKKHHVQTSLSKEFHCKEKQRNEGNRTKGKTFLFLRWKK
jgi:hypothetical protein